MFAVITDGPQGGWNDGDAGSASWNGNDNTNGAGFNEFTSQDARGDLNTGGEDDGKCHNCGQGGQSFKIPASQADPQDRWSLGS